MTCRPESAQIARCWHNEACRLSYEGKDRLCSALLCCWLAGIKCCSLGADCCRFRFITARVFVPLHCAVGNAPTAVRFGSACASCVAVRLYVRVVRVHHCDSLLPHCLVRPPKSPAEFLRLYISPSRDLIPHVPSHVPIVYVSPLRPSCPVSSRRLSPASSVPRGVAIVSETVP